MADSKLTDLTALGAVTNDDILYIVDDPAGAANSRKITRSNLLGAALIDLDDLGVVTGDSDFLVGTGAGTLAWESGATARTSLGLAIGTNVQAWDAQLDDIAALAVTDGNIIVGDGANWVAESGATARTSLGLGTGDSPQFTEATLSSAAATKLVFTRTDVPQTWHFGAIAATGEFNMRDFTNNTYPFLVQAATPTYALRLKTFEVVINDNQDNIDFRIESDTDTSLLVADAGNNAVGIGAYPGTSGKLVVTQTSATGAIPTLYLNQSDIDQPLIQLETTIGTGNAIEAVGAKTLTPTHFIMIEIPGGLTRYIQCGTIA